MIIPGHTNPFTDFQQSIEGESDFVLWPVNGECTEWATITYFYKNQFGTRVVSDIITDKELSRSECEEAITNTVRKVEFEQSMTIKYKA